MKSFYFFMDEITKALGNQGPCLTFLLSKKIKDHVGSWTLEVKGNSGLFGNFISHQSFMTTAQNPEHEMGAMLYNVLQQLKQVCMNKLAENDSIKETTQLKSIMEDLNKIQHNDK